MQQLLHGTIFEFNNFIVNFIIICKNIFAFFNNLVNLYCYYILKETFMKKLIFAALASAAACLCVAFAACTETAPGGIEYTVEVSNNIIVAFVAPQSVDEKNLSVKDYFDGLVEAGKLTYEISDGMVESINGQSNSAATMSYWMFYSDLGELDGVAYTDPSYTYDYNGKELGSCNFGVELMPVVGGYTYVAVFDSLA